MDYKSEFIKCFNSFSGKHRRDQVFSDFITMASASLHNAVAYRDDIEGGYMQAVKKYDKDELERFPELLGMVVNGLEGFVCDFLGDVYMSLELGNTRAGQFFTPWHVSKLMAAVSYSDRLANIKEDFITFCDPACGAGCLPIAFVDVMTEAGHNPQQKLWAQCWDIDSTAAQMCYIQLALLHIPAEIVIGNSLTLEVRQVMKTPAHYLGFWDVKLKGRKQAQKDVGAGRALLELTKTPDRSNEKIISTPDFNIDGGQLEIGF